MVKSTVSLWVEVAKWEEGDDFYMEPFSLNVPQDILVGDLKDMVVKKSREGITPIADRVIPRMKLVLGYRTKLDETKQLCDFIHLDNSLPQPYMDTLFLVIDVPGFCV